MLRRPVLADISVRQRAIERRKQAIVAMSFGLWFKLAVFVAILIVVAVLGVRARRAAEAAFERAHQRPGDKDEQ